MIMQTQQPRTGQYIKQEVGSISRDKVTFSGGEFWPGEVYAVVGGVAVKLDPVGVDGSENAVGITYAHVDASAADVDGVATTRLTEVNNNALIWPGTADDAFKASSAVLLAVKNIIVRGL